MSEFEGLAIRPSIGQYDGDIYYAMAIDGTIDGNPFLVEYSVDDSGDVYSTVLQPAELPYDVQVILGQQVLRQYMEVGATT